jgi:hypothetical protein
VAWKLADLFVQITGNTAPLATALTGVKAKLLGFAQLGATVASQFIANLSGGLSGVLSLLGKTGAGAATVAIAAAAIALGGLGKAVTLASDLNETVAKTEQVFGTATDKVVESANEMAHAFGIPKAEFLDAASMFGLIAQGAGVASGKSAEMSVSLAKLAADASSFYNVDVGTALEKIRAGLVGEAEPLRAFGVMLSEDAVHAKALAMGLAQPGKELTNQAKIMARYALIQEGLAKASGDLERTGGGFANQWRMFTGQLVNLGTTIGQVVLPAFNALLRVVNGALGSLSSAFDWMYEKWQGVLEFFGLGVDKANQEKERADIDARNKKMTEQIQAEEANALAMKNPRKSFQGGLEEWSKKIQEAAWTKKGGAAETNKILQDQLKILNDIKNGINMPPQAPPPGFAA